MTSRNAGSNVVPEPVYSREVFERLRETLDVHFTGDAAIASADSYIKPNYELRDEGAVLRANREVDALNWTPACDMQEGPASPDPLSTPALPFPFTARQLAAFLMDGWGWFLHERFADEHGELDQEIVQTLLGGVRDAKPREAIAAAFAALTQARQYAGEPDASLARAEQAAAAALSDATKEAEGLHDWREAGIGEHERSARVQRRNEMTAAAKAALRRAQEEHREGRTAWRRRMVQWLLVAKRGKLSQQEWGPLSNSGKAAAWLEGRAPAASPEEKRQQLIGWYDATVSAHYWFGLASVTAVEAAQLLSQENPHGPASTNWLETTTEHLNPEAKRELLRGFEDVGGKRPLTEWLQRAKSSGWRYDPWVDEYIAIGGLKLAESSVDAERATRPVPRARAQEVQILAKFKELGLDPMMLPRPKPGKSSPPVKRVRTELRYSTDVMQKAMSRLFQDGRAAYCDTSAD